MIGTPNSPGLAILFSLANSFAMKCLSTAILAATLAAAAPASESHGGREKGLGELAKKAGLLYFGTAIDNVAFNDSKYLSIAYDKKQFSQVTPSNGQKVRRKKAVHLYFVY